VLELLAHLESRGLQRAALCEAAGLEGELLGQGPEARVPIGQLFGLWAAAMRQLREPGLPVEVARKTRLEKFGLLGFLLVSSVDGRQAIERGLRFSRLFTDSGRWSLQQGPTLALRWRREGELSLGHRCANEAAVVSFVRLLQQVFDTPPLPLRVTFRHPAPQQSTALADFFERSPEFGQPQDGVWLDPSVLDQVPRLSDPALSAFLEAQAHHRLDAAPPSQELSLRVHKAIEAELPAGGPSLSLLCRRLGASERSLRRYLQEEGTSFRGLVERVRRERAEDLLRFGHASMGEIAAALGFSDAGTFSRAFRRWTGLAPTEFRERS
jgi:AraC-like DNA-binding protein